jgi:uncharacterized repeat protein (TIGR01451 family)
MNKFSNIIFLSLILFLFSTSSFGALIQRTITINGNMSDWTAAPDILNNAGQFTTDCQVGEACELDAISGSGRDLGRFSFTWDANNLYLYVYRHTGNTSTTDWLFYLDEDASGTMDTGERIFRIQWQGSNRKTNALLCPYFPVDTVNGDPLVDGGGNGDGYDMPGSSDNGQCSTLYSNVVAGSIAGTEMEAQLAWSQLGFPGPQNIGFHVSSSTGVNLPNQIIDNVDPIAGAQLFSPDMSIDIGSIDTQVQSNSTITYDITLTNTPSADFTNVTVDLSFPAQLQYSSHVAPAGTSFVDTDFDTYPDQWQIPLLLLSSSMVLQVTALAQPVAFDTNVNTTVDITGSTEVDTDPTNDTDTIATLITPAPKLTVVKYSTAGASEDPSTVVTYSALVSNSSGLDAMNVVVTEDLPDFTSFLLGSVSYTDGPAPYTSSGLTISTTEYFNGVTWAYVPVSGGGGAPAGYDANVEQIRVTFTGNISNGQGFLLEFTSIIN